MEKRKLAGLAIVGISAGLMMTGCQMKSNGKGNGKGNGNGNGDNGGKLDAAEQMSPDMLSFFNSLSPEAQKKFMELDPKHRMMSVEMAHQSCKGENKCAGMGGCATSTHACGGLNACKGQGGAPIQDPNKAVDMQYKHMMKMKQNGR